MIVVCNRSPRGNQGYSLIELLLTTALLLMFAGVAAISLKTMTQGAALNEGAIRFESVLRFARAEAANTGRRVRMNFLQDTNCPSASQTNQLNQIQLTWEPDPVAQPDVFQNLSGAQWGLDQVNETVGVETVRLPSAIETAPDWPAEGDVAEQEILADIPAEEDDSAAAPPAFITFNPDGSCDTAEITLAARSAEETRHVTLRIEGLTGSIRRSEEAAADSEQVAMDRNESPPADR
jgi:prepilin-type N-terminal cleavage/methylation domain-containing protein